MCHLLCNYAVYSCVREYEYNRPMRRAEQTFFDRQEAGFLSRVPRLKKFDDSTAQALDAVGANRQFVQFTSPLTSDALVRVEQVCAHVDELYQRLLSNSTQYHFLRFLVRSGVSVHLYTRQPQLYIDACPGVDWNARLVALLLGDGRK
jgi:hypothetical protein